MTFWIGGSTSVFNGSQIKITEYIRYPACRGEEPDYSQLMLASLLNTILIGSIRVFYGLPNSVRSGNFV